MKPAKPLAAVTRASPGWGLLDTSLGLALAAWLFTGGLLALWQTQQASERLRGLQAWSGTEQLARQFTAQRLQRSGAPQAVRRSAGVWALQAPWPALSVVDARLGPWQFAHATSNTAINCQGGAVPEAWLTDAYSFASPDRLLCHNPQHAGNTRQTLWGGVAGWTIEAAVRLSDSPERWQWQTLSPVHTGEAIAALRVCWRTTPEYAMATPQVGRVAPPNLACALPALNGLYRDRWQVIPRWHGQRAAL